GHLSVSNGPTNLVPGEWGVGRGSSQINGGPYHFHALDADNTQLGSQDNQVKGADILCVPPPCEVTGGPGGPVSPGTQTTCSASSVPGLTYVWSVSGNGTIVGSNTGQTVTVMAGTGCHAPYTVQVTTSNGGKTATCGATVQGDDSTKPVITCPAGQTVQCPADIPPPGGATATDNCSPPVITSVDGPIVPATGACGQMTRTYTATDACGNQASCTQVFTINDTTKPVLTGCPSDTSVQCFSDVPAA